MAFRSALERLAGRARHEPTAIMCAEEDPKRCHCLLLACADWVRRYGGMIFHIRGNERIELEKRAAEDIRAVLRAVDSQFVLNKIQALLRPSEDTRGSRGGLPSPREDSFEWRRGDLFIRELYLPGTHGSS